MKMTCNYDTVVKIFQFQCFSSIRKKRNMWPTNKYHRNSWHIHVGFFDIVKLLKMQTIHFRWWGVWCSIWPPSGTRPLLTSVPSRSPLLKCYSVSCRWWLVWFFTLSLRPHFSIFSSSPRAVIIPPSHANAAAEDLVWSHHRDINPALLPSTDYCTTANAG